MKRRPDDVLAGHGGALELLRIPAALYGAVTGVRRVLYDVGLMPTKKVAAPVISVGNLTAGGTGKTPFVIWLVRELQARGLRPAVLSRGYRAPKEGEHSETLANDEARMLERVLPGVLHAQNPDRVAGARDLIRAGAEVIVLDDGFQHRRLRRDLDLVLIDATRPWGLAAGEHRKAVRAMLPRGLLREHPKGLQRAHAIILTRSDQLDTSALQALEAELDDIVPGLPILRAVHRPVRLSGAGEPALPLHLRGRDVDLVSALGNPAGFESTVRSLGANVCDHRKFPDHHHFAPNDLDGLGQDGRWVITTAKDAVKLDSVDVAFRVLEVELGLSSGQAVMAAMLDALPRGRSRLERDNLHEGLHG